MASKFKAPPKSMTDKLLPTAIGMYDKLAREKYNERMSTLNIIAKTANDVKKAEKQKEVLDYVTDVLKIVDAERKALLVEAKKKLYETGADDGAARKPSRSPQYAKWPEFMKAYVDGYNYGLKVKEKPGMQAR